MGHRHLLYGLVVDSEIDLHQDRPAPRGPTADVHIRAGAPVAAQLPGPDGDLMVSFDDDSGPRYAFVRNDDGYLMRFHGACDIVLSRDLREVVVRPAAGAAPGLSTVLVSGAMLAFQLYLRGHLVLHASAVDLGGTALAFLGRSGMGKSTMAALLCSAGGKLITDDVLRVETPGSDPQVRLGATELRLRKGADTLVERFPVGPGRRTSADLRQVLRLGGEAADRLPLSGIVIPQPSPGLDRLVIEAMPAKEALFAVLSFPRLVGWHDPAVVQNQFAATSELLSRVPVVIARVPWGPPFQPDIPANLVDALAPHLGTLPTPWAAAADMVMAP
jgi:hypothetical protein